MHNSQFTYWIYAIIAKKYGREVKIKRDELHAVYEVNRYGVELTSHNIPISEIRKFLESKLKEAGFVTTKKEPDYFKKTVGDEDRYVYLNTQPKFYHFPESLRVSPMIYRKMK